MKEAALGAVLGLHQVQYTGAVTFSLQPIGADIDVDSNNDGKIDASDDPLEEQSPGKLLVVGEPKTQIKLALPAGIVATSVRLTIDSGAQSVRIWSGIDGGATTIAGGNGPTEVSWNVGDAPTTLGIEALTEFVSARPVTDDGNVATA